jgi:hypothetical protein
MGWARAGQADSGFVAFYRQRFTLPLFYYDTSEIQKPWELLKYFCSDRNLKFLLRIAGCFPRSDCQGGGNPLFHHDNPRGLSPPETRATPSSPQVWITVKSLELLHILASKLLDAS